MPFSDSTLRPWTLERLRVEMPLDTIHTVVDVGAGGGANLEFYWPWMPHTKWTAIEAWPAYVDRFELNVRYATCLVEDVRTMDLPVADLYIFGDVLEHMSKDDAVALWARARAVSRTQIINMPIVTYHQGAVHGNPFEAHLHHWDENEILASLPGIFAHTSGPVVGSFLARS